MNRPLGEKSSFKSGLGYVCLLILLVLLFYWEGLGAHLDSLDLCIVCQEEVELPKWYLIDSWKPLWYGLIHLAYLSFGINSPPYHLVNLTLYIATLLLLYPLYNSFFNDKTISKISVLLFATFYLHAETINQFTSNRELLKTLFIVATLLYFSYYRKTPHLRHYILALLFGVFACLSEEASVCLPLLLLAVDYHVLHGTFPPKLQPLKAIGRGLLPHLPFWLMTLALLGYTLIAGYIIITFYDGSIKPGGSAIVEWSRTRTFHDILNQSFLLAIYTFAPCYPSNKLTALLGTIVMAGIGWLFYRSSSQGRSLILTMTACTGFSLAPYTIVGPTPRYFFLPSVFSMFLVALLTFEMARRIYGLLEERLQGYRLSAQHTITAFTILILLPAIYLNYRDVRQYTKNTGYAGKLVREIVEGTARVLPQGSEETKIVYVNLPVTVKSDAILSQDIFVAYSNLHFSALYLYGDQCLIPRLKDKNVKTVYLDLGYGRVSLDSRAWYDLAKAPHAINLSPKEFDMLSRDGRNKILFFSPATNRLMDISGWNYKQLAESTVQQGIISYRTRKKENITIP